MKYLDEFRDPEKSRLLLDEIRKLASRPWRIMDVCGGQTHNLLKYGIEAALTPTVEMIHGPGCPVCVTPGEVIDDALQISLQPNTLLMTYGDMLRVPGTTSSLNETRATGGNLRTIYTPVEAVEYARDHPDIEVVFFAVGFETTIPATALAIQQAARLELKNFSVLAHHVRVLPAMRQLMQGTENRIDAFLAAGHVCTITGFEDYHEFSREFEVPVVITGFEPIDLLLGVRTAVDLLEHQKVTIVNEYTRSVSSARNEHAHEFIDKVFEVIDQHWRGLGVIPRGGFGLRDRWLQFDAKAKFGLSSLQIESNRNSVCRSGEVLQGIIKPFECPSFGTSCHPEQPLGAPMVSSEGACAAYFRYNSDVNIQN